MSNEINTGGPAYPLNWEKQGEFWAFGMTLRDYFAAKAMQGMLSSGNLPKSVTNEVIALEAYYLADAMLIAREPKSESN